MDYDIASISLVGDREHNEDFATCTTLREGGVVAVVCDGLGGHARGEWASRAFAEAAVAATVDTPAACVTSRDNAKRHFTEVFLKGRDNISYKLALEESDDDPKTTAVIVALRDEGLAIAHVGDSRAYRLAPGAEAWRTRDHSVVQMLLDEGSITEEEMAQHPDQGRLFKSVGTKRDDAPSVTVQPPLESGEAMLLCTDGFWEYVTTEERQNLLQATNLQAYLETLALTSTSRAQGRSDNVTALCVRARAVTLPTGD
ncbi:MAG: serine/threonine-protein phosphatase [Halioglobus sp.]|nr:serine/threonine-protein phosphatase [Halioglobus sp.]